VKEYAGKDSIEKVPVMKVLIIVENAFPVVPVITGEE